MTNLGPLGWVTDAAGYRYEAASIRSDRRPWPPMPAGLLDALGRALRPGVRARLPAWSISIAPARGWACIRTATRRTSAFRCSRSRSATRPSSASAARAAATRPGPMRLASGDVCVLAGDGAAARTTASTGSSPARRDLIPGGGRINLTLRARRGVSPSQSIDGREDDDFRHVERPCSP